MNDTSKLLLNISFVGTAYSGYQVQKGKPTVQAALNRAAVDLFGFECDVVGCSRTDSGVHAKTFCVAVSQKGAHGLPSDIPAAAIPKAMNAHLPDDISVNAAVRVANDFHPRYDVVSKEYEYLICDDPIRNPFMENRAWQYGKRLDAEKMNFAAQYFCGKHDFSAFMAAGSKIKEPIRTVFSTRVARQNGTVIFSVCADGFLYHMVRIMVGTLIPIGLEKAEPSSVCEIIAGAQRKNAGVTAPACGLYLNRVTYRESFFEK